MKSIKANILFVLFLFSGLFLIGLDTVKADSLSIDDNDYQLECLYDGNFYSVILTIWNNGVTLNLANESYNIDTLASSYEFFATDEQKTVNQDGTVVYNSSKIAGQGRCPTKLYVYFVSSIYAKETPNEESISGDPNVYIYYYSTSSDIVNAWGVDKFLWMKNPRASKVGDVSLISEQVVHHNPKGNVKICNYTKNTQNAFSQNGKLSVYLYDNITIVNVDNYYTSLEGEVWNDCKEGEVYINNPRSQPIGNTTLSTYNYKRFFIGSKDTCKQYNNNDDCDGYKYFDTFEPNKVENNIQENVCDIFGNETVKQIQKIVNILQFLVPILTIVLSGFDLGKIVISGNLDEELPKKKKVIIVRLILMAFFFFLPLITNLLINLLNNTGIINVDNPNCILEESKTEGDE